MGQRLLVGAAEARAGRRTDVTYFESAGAAEPTETLSLRESREDGRGRAERCHRAALKNTSGGL